VGKTGQVQFPEITDFVAFYMQNDFIPDSQGNPIRLRLPNDHSTGSAPERRPTFKNPPVLGDENGAQMTGEGRSTFRNPPTFDEMAEEESSDPPAAPGDGSTVFSPSCGWPASDEEEEDVAPSFLTRGKGEKSDAMAEKEAFEAIMNGGGDDDAIDHNPASQKYEVNLDKMDRALAEMEGEKHNNADDSDDGLQNGLEAFAKKLFTSLPLSAAGFLEGKDARPVLMKSGLDMQILGKIWMEIDVEQRGQLDLEQFTLILGLISQVQFGQAHDVSTLDISSIPPPQMQP